jgi:heat shock protein HslJ
MMAGKFFKTLHFKTLRSGVVFAVILTLAAGAVFGVVPAAAEEELVVFPGGLPRVLTRVAADSGERYEAAGDPSTFFLSGGTGAVLKINGRDYVKYVLIRDFSDSDEFILTVDGKNYSMRDAISASGAKYEAVGDPSTVLWSKGSAASLVVGGREYSDYDVWRPDGEIWLPDQGLPIELEWKAASIAGSEVIPGSDVTLTFHKDGKLSGKASINNYTSSWLASGYKILIAEGASTQMAGPRDLMEQESRFFEFLSETTRFDFRKEGLVLIDKNGQELLLKH